MNKTYLALIVVVVIVAVGGFLFLAKPNPAGAPALTASSSIPANMAISEELGGNKVIAQNNLGKVVASCNIPNDSQCLDYIGKSYTKQMVKSLCTNPGATLSGEPCNHSASVGACRAMIGTDQEIASWAYSGGGKPVTDKNIRSYIMMCYALPNSEWIDPSGKPVTKPIPEMQ